MSNHSGPPLPSRRFLAVVKRQIAPALPNEVLYGSKVHIRIQNLNGKKSSSFIPQARNSKLNRFGWAKQSHGWTGIKDEPRKGSDSSTSE